MFQDDYIARRIRLFTQVLARIFKLIDDEELGTALDATEIAFRDFLGVDMSAFLEIPDDRLIDFLVFGEGSIGAHKLNFAIALLVYGGDIHADRDNQDLADRHYRKALALLLEAHHAVDAETGEPAPMYLAAETPTIGEVLEALDIDLLPDDLRGPLVFYFEQQGNYSQANVVLKAMLAASPGSLEVRELARSFYEVLLEESDAVLEAGGMQRAAIEQALKALI